MKKLFIILALFGSILVGCSNKSESIKEEFSFHDIVFNDNNKDDFELTENEILEINQINEDYKI